MGRKKGTPKKLSTLIREGKMMARGSAGIPKKRAGTAPARGSSKKRAKRRAGSVGPTMSTGMFGPYGKIAAPTKKYIRKKKARYKLGGPGLPGTAKKYTRKKKASSAIPRVSIPVLSPPPPRARSVSIPRSPFRARPKLTMRQPATLHRPKSRTYGPLTKKQARSASRARGRKRMKRVRKRLGKYIGSQGGYKFYSRSTFGYRKGRAYVPAIMNKEVRKRRGLQVRHPNYKKVTARQAVRTVRLRCRKARWVLVPAYCRKPSKRRR